MNAFPLLQADFADDEAKPEVLAIRFSNAENAKKFKFKFEEAVKAVTSAKAKEIKDEEGKLSEMVKKVDIGQEESKEWKKVKRKLKVPSQMNYERFIVHITCPIFSPKVKKKRERAKSIRFWYLMHLLKNKRLR